MNKFFIIFLYALILSFTWQYFFPPQKTSQLLEKRIVLSVEKDALVQPNIPKITLINHSHTGITLDPCTDITLSLDSQIIPDIAAGYPAFCQTYTIEAGESRQISFDPLAQYFANHSGTYLVSLKTSEGESNLLLSITPPGSIRSFLTRVVYEPIYNLFVALITYLPGHSLGWAIVIITLIIRLMLLVPQHHMLQSQQKMQVIQPKIKALQKKYKDDQSKLGMEMIELYKKEGVNPMGSCLPLLIQMPILIGLYWVVSGINDPSNFYHLYSFFTSFRPSEIDAHFLGINLLQIGGMTAGFFAVALALVQYIQAKLSFGYQKTPETTITPKIEGDTPEMALDPEMMKKMMLYIFPFTIGVSAYFFPLGVGLYWFIGTLFVIAQQAYVNKKK